MSEPILKVENMNKKFGSTVALNDVSLSVYPGEIRGLIGENGSGKSTVTSIVAGMQPCDSGKMFFKGQEWKPQSMIDALHRGIGMIVQESGTIQGVTVAENIFLAETEKYKNKFGLVNRKKMNADATEVMKNIGVNDVTGDMQMQQLDFQTRKLVEIAKVVMKQPQILVIDETSTALSHDGRQVLYDIMNRFRKENKSVIFISHDLDEIMDVCDTLTVLRDGKIIRTFVKEEFEAGAIRASMIGRELQGDYYRSDFKATSQPQVVLHLPPIITSLGVTLIYEGILFTITEGRYVMKEVQNKSMTAFTGNWIYAAIIIVAVLLISIAIFDYTKFGYDYNALKNGQKVAVNTGIKEIPNAIGCYVICGGLMGIVGFLNAARNTTINGGQLNFGSISIMFTAFLPMFIGSYISRFTNEKIGFFLAALCMSMLNSTFAVFSNEVNASMQAIINAVLLVVFLIYLSNEQLLVKIFTGKRKA